MNSRRSFIWNMGAGASAALASTAGMAKPAEVAAAGNPALRAALLEEEKLLRSLHQAFEQALDRGLHDQVIGMFADDAQVVFNGGVFSRRLHGVSRLYGEIFPAGKTGARMESAPGFELAPAQLRDSVEVAADLRSATGEFPYSIRVGRPLESDTSLVAMARLHGEGVQTWWEGGVYRVSWRKDDAGRWQISRLAYHTLSRADYRAGRSYAQPITVAPFLAQYPADPLGPDTLAQG